MRKYVMIPVLSVAAAVGLNIVLLAIDIAKYSEAYQKTAEILYAPGLVEQILYVGILVPILEEIVFRRFVFRFIRKRLSFGWAMIVSSVVFGAYHGNLVQFVYAGLCGLLLAYVYEIYDSLKAPIIAHISMNITACLLTQFGVFEWIMKNVLREVSITLLCVFVFVIFLLVIQKMDVTKVLKKYCKDNGNEI